MYDTTVTLKPHEKWRPGMTYEKLIRAKDEKLQFSGLTNTWTMPVAIGPMLTASTATNRDLGQGKWQAGFAAVGLHSLSAGGEVIGILTWQHSFAGEHTRPDAQTLTFQPIVALSIGGGYYVRSSGIWSFGIPNNKRVIPLGIAQRRPR